MLYLHQKFAWVLIDVSHIFLTEFQQLPLLKMDMPTKDGTKYLIKILHVL